MASDPNLIKASFNLANSEAAANTPDMSNVYKSNVDIGKTYLNVVSGIGKEMALERKKNELGREKQLESLKAVIKRNYSEMIQKGGNQGEETIMAVREGIKKIEDDFLRVNTYGDNDSDENEYARIQLEARAAKLISSVRNSRDFFDKLGTRVDNLRVEDITKFKGHLLDPMRRAMDVDNHKNDPGVVVRYDHEKEDLVYEVDGDFSMTLDEMVESLPEYDIAKHNRIAKFFNAATETAKIDAQSETPVNQFKNDEYLQGQKIQFKKEINNEEDFLDVSGAKIIGDRSFREGLINRADISVATIRTMVGENEADIGALYAAMDHDNSGGINFDKDLAELTTTEAREEFKKNYELLIDAITNPENEAFNLSISKDLLADYYVGLKKQNYDNTYNYYDKEKKNEFDSTSGNYKVGSNGFLTNPALIKEDGSPGVSEYKGYKLGRNGNVLYDDVATLDKINKGESFIGPFENEYRKVIRKGKHVGYEIYGIPQGGSSVKFITFVDIEKAKLWTTGKVKTNNNIG
jgi:hypothetical protein